LIEYSVGREGEKLCSLSQASAVLFLGKLAFSKVA
jgi:hypothetical protein